MWIFYLVLAIGLWSVTNIFYKQGADESDKYISLKFSIVTGIIFLLIGIVYLVTREESFTIWESALRFWPITLFGIAYCIINTVTYKGFLYNDSSIYASVSNTANGSYVILLIIIYVLLGRVNSVWDVLNIYKILGIASIFGSLIILAFVQHKIALKENKKEDFKAGASALIFPIVFSFMDGMETIVTGVCLDKNFGYAMPEGDSIIIISLEYAFFAFCLWIYVSMKQKKLYNPICKGNKPFFIGTLCDNIGIVCYSYAMALDSVSTDPLLAIYPVLTVLLAKVFLKEKLTSGQHVCILLMIFGSVMMALGRIA